MLSKAVRVEPLPDMRTILHISTDKAVGRERKIYANTIGHLTS